MKNYTLRLELIVFFFTSLKNLYNHKYKLISLSYIIKFIFFNF